LQALCLGREPKARVPTLTTSSSLTTYLLGNKNEKKFQWHLGSLSLMSFTMRVKSLSDYEPCIIKLVEVVLIFFLAKFVWALCLAKILWAIFILSFARLELTISLVQISGTFVLLVENFFIISS
jgi:hypothetical protein